MKKMLTFVIVLSVVLGATSISVAQAPYSGVVTIDSVQARPTESVAVKVWLRNNTIDISAMSIPLQFSSSALTLDSVSTQESVWGSDFAFYASIDNTDRTARITILPNDMTYPLPTVSFVDGVVAELHFTVAADVVPHRASIDSIYTDSSVGGDVHVFTRIDISDNSGTSVFLPDFVAGDIEVLMPTGLDDDLFELGLPTDYELAQNYPNPFNPSTIISFSLPSGGIVNVDVFNILGQQVITLVSEYREAGVHQVEFNGANFPSGIYFYRLQHSGGTATRKMTLVK
jgi:hypothetical protein